MFGFWWPHWRQNLGITSEPGRVCRRLELLSKDGACKTTTKFSVLLAKSQNYRFNHDRVS
jgi:hypothetical protein